MFGLINRGQLPGPVEDEFEQLASRIRALWLQEHNENGSHRYGKADVEARVAAAEANLTASIDSLTASVGTKLDEDVFLEEHNADGTHGDVTAAKLYERGRTVALGEPIAIPYSAGNFSGNGTLVWTVDAADQNSFSYALVGKMMILWFSLIGTSVSGTGNFLRILIPGGFLAAVQSVEWCRLVDNGVERDAIAFTNAASPLVVVARRDVANLAASTDNTHVQGRIHIPLL